MDKDRGTIWEQDRSKRNAQQINRREKHEWTIQRHRHHWEQDRTKRNTKQITQRANRNGQHRDTDSIGNKTEQRETPNK